MSRELSLYAVRIRLLMKYAPEFALTSYISFWTILAGASFAYVWANVSVLSEPLMLSQADQAARCRELLT